MTTLVRNDLRAAAATAAKSVRLALGFGTTRLQRDRAAGTPREVGGWRRLRKAYSALLVLPFCGCTYLDPAPPAPAQVADYASQSATLVVSDFNAEGKVYTRRMFSSEYLLASISYTNNQCNLFFDKLNRLQQDSSFVDKVLAASITASTPLLAAYGAGTAAVAATGASIAFVQNVNNFANDIFFYSQYSGALKEHVVAEMADFAQHTIGPLWNKGFLKEGACQTVGSCSNELERMILVRDLAQQYANKCSIANFRKIISSSLSVTTSVCPGNNNNSSQEVATISNCKSIPKPPPTGKKGVSG